MRSPRRGAAVLSLALAATLGLAGCGDEDDAAGGGGSGTPTAGADAPAATATPVLQVDSLSGVQTTITVDQGFADAVTGLGLSAGTVGSARISGSDLVFPISGGNVTYYPPDSGVRPFVQGNVQHEGAGLSFTKDGTTVELTDLVVDPGTSVLTGRVTVNGKVAAERANLFVLDGGSLQPLQVDEAAGTAVLAGTQVRLHPDAAALLNQAFRTDGLDGQLPVGTGTLTLAVPSPT